MSTSPPCSFLVAWANAASTAPNTTSRSTLLSREMASTSISISRFMACIAFRLSSAWPAPSGGGRPCAAALEIQLRHQPRLAHLVQVEIQRLGGIACFARQHQPPTRLARLQLAAPVLAALERRAQREVDLAAGKARPV